MKVGDLVTLSSRGRGAIYRQQEAKGNWVGVVVEVVKWLGLGFGADYKVCWAASIDSKKYTETGTYARNELKHVKHKKRLNTLEPSASKGVR